MAAEEAVAAKMSAALPTAVVMKNAGEEVGVLFLNDEVVRKLLIVQLQLLRELTLCFPLFQDCQSVPYS